MHTQQAFYLLLLLTVWVLTMCQASQSNLPYDKVDLSSMTINNEEETIHLKLREEFSTNCKQMSEIVGCKSYDYSYYYIYGTCAFSDCVPTNSCTLPISSRFVHPDIVEGGKHNHERSPMPEDDRRKPLVFKHYGGLRTVKIIRQLIKKNKT